MLVFALQCDQCSFRVGPTGGGYMYVLGADGKRVVCPHPIESTVVERATGMSWADASQKGLVYHAVHVLCSRCAEVFDADYRLGEPVEARCPRCEAPDARPVLDSADIGCPRCLEGKLRRQDVGVA